MHIVHEKKHNKHLKTSNSEMRSLNLDRIAFGYNSRLPSSDVLNSDLPLYRFTVQ